MYRRYSRFPLYRRPWRRRFLTEEEKKAMKESYQENRIKRIERYKEFLEKELAGVNEWLEKQKKKVE